MKLTILIALCFIQPAPKAKSITFEDLVRYESQQAYARAVAEYQAKDNSNRLGVSRLVEQQEKDHKGLEGKEIKGFAFVVEVSEIKNQEGKSVRVTVSCPNINPNLNIQTIAKDAKDDMLLTLKKGQKVKVWGTYSHEAGRAVIDCTYSK